MEDVPLAVRNGNAASPFQTESLPTLRVPGPKRTINLLLLLVLLSAVFLDYWQYSRSYHQNANVYLDLVAGTALAPAQYRVGVVDTAYSLASHTHLPLRDWLTLLDLVSAATAGFVLLTILRRSRAYLSAVVPVQWLGEVSFVALFQFYLGWLLWYQRPETLPTAALLTLALLFLTLPLGNKLVAPVISALGLLGVTLAQSFVRADVAFAFHLGVLVVCLLRPRASFVLRRMPQAAVSCAGLFAAVAIQLFLMRVEFPHATYGDTPVVQLVKNVRDATGYLPFLCVMLPVAWALWRVAVKKTRIASAEAALLTAACLFTAMWFVVGIAQEVRIFLPYGIVLIPLLVTLLLRMVAPVEDYLPGTQASA